MNSSPNIDLLAAALVAAHADIKGVVKSATNPYFKSKYATLESVVEAVKEPLLKRGIVVIQGLQDAENGVAVETMLLHTSGQWISSTLRLPASKEDAQGYGSACTYGRRYGLMAICGVPAEDDDGNAATASAPAKKGMSGTDGAFAALDPIEQEQAKEIAANIVELWTTDKEHAAYEAFYEAGLSNELKLGIWELLRPNSKVRNGIKKISDANKEPVSG
jgi:hypothetical protein